MNLLRVAILTILLLLPTVLMAQTPWEPTEELLTADDAESEQWEQNAELLALLSEQKINLNTATREDLEQLPFLNQTQIEQICEYLLRYGPAQSWGELAMVESLDVATRSMLASVTYLGEATPADELSLAQKIQRGNHLLTATARIPFYERRGDENGYLGYPYRHSLRYTFQFGQQLKAGFVGAQDSGEPFFANRNKAGYDHYSFFITARGKRLLRQITVGRYRLRLGQGLVLNNDFGFGKLASLSTTDRSFSTIRGHSSRMSANYLQGAAAQLALAKDLTATLFLSYRKIDATLAGESSDTIRTLLSTGYHRTPTEMSHKNDASELLGGGRLAFRHAGFHAGLTAVANRLDKPLQPNTAQVFRQIYPQGQTFWNASADYGYLSRRLTVNGETATGSCHGLATLNTVRWRPLGSLVLVALQRFYSYRYYALHSESFSEGSNIQNESGLLLGAEWQPRRRLTVKAYTDYVYFPWARYQASESSHAWDNLASVTFQKGNWQFFGRYRLRFRERDNAEKTALTQRTEQRLRASATLKNDFWNMKTQFDLCAASSKENTSTGWMVSQQAGLHRRNWAVTALLAYFHTQDYDSRVYLFEPAPQYSFALPMFYGEGIRYLVMAQAAITSRLQLLAKLSTTNYFDRPTIGTGLQTINHSSQTDLELQLRWRLTGNKTRKTAISYNY